MDPIGKIIIGERPAITVHLATEHGTPISGASIALYIDDAMQERSTTGQNGTAVLKIRKDRADIPAGTHQLLVIFYGDPGKGLQPAHVEQTLVISPGEIEVDTVPALPGVQIQVSSALDLGSPWGAPATTTVTADAKGIIRIPVAETGSYRLTVLPWHSPDPTMRATFSRWEHTLYLPTRIVNYEPGLRLLAGFETSDLVSVHFTDLAGAPIDTKTITSYTLKSSMGDHIERSDEKPIWLPSTRVGRLGGDLEVLKIYYSMDEVMVDGSNVVHHAQYRFQPTETQKWTIPLLYFSAHFSGADAIFGSPKGSSVKIIAPDGQAQVVPLGKDGTAYLPSLPRGTYTVQVLGGGYSPPAPVALSKNQSVNLVVVSYLDMALVAGLGIVIVVGLLLVGRRSLVLYPFRVVRQGWQFVVVNRPRRVES
jgi:hypothetical protein